MPAPRPRTLAFLVASAVEVSGLLLGPLGLSPVGTALAQPAPATLDLSLGEAQARASRLAPEVRIAESQVREAAATRVGAGVRLPANPRVSLDARPGIEKGARDEIGFAGSLDLLFEVGDVPGSRLREAEARTKAARADAAVAHLDARLHAMELYVGARLAALRITHAQEAIVLGERVLGAARERSSAGAGSDIDVTSAVAELAEFRAELHAAEAERTRNEMELRYLLGIDAATSLRLTTPIEAPPPAPTIDALVARARTHRPDLAAIEARIAFLAASDERLRLEARPKVGAFGGVDASPLSPVFGIVGLSVELPVAQRNQGPRAVVAAERQTELDRLALVSRRIDLALRSARGAYEARRSAIAVLATDGIPAAETRFGLVETGWRAGRFDIFRLTSAAQDLVRLRATRVELLERIWEERILLERLMGGWTDERSNGRS